MGISPVRAARAVFFDRDGVLNKAIVVNCKPRPPASLAETRLVSGAAAGCKALKKAGFLLFAVTNQPDVARGTVSRKTVDEINGYLRTRLGLDDVRCCFHDDGDHCSCRKPKPGMLRDLARAWHVDLRCSFVVGDRWKDIEAGKRAGCRTVFLNWGYAERQPAEPDAAVGSFPGAVEFILQLE